MNTFYKNIIRDMKTTLGKVFSIGVMVGLATMIIVGLNLTGPSMRKSLDESLNIYKHPDIIVRSTYPMDYEDQILLENDNDIKDISFIKIIDLENQNQIIRIKSFDKNFEKIDMVDGQKLKAKNEIILDKALKSTYKIGDYVDFSYINDKQKDTNKLRNTKYKVVGFFNTSQRFLEDMKEISPVGKKEISGLAFISKENFEKEEFDEVNISYKTTEDLNKTSDEYKQIVKDKKDAIDKVILSRPKEVLEKIKTEANDKINKAEGDLSDAREKISETEKELKDAKIKIDDGFSKYGTEKAKYHREIENAKAKLTKARNDLITGQAELDKAKLELENSRNKYDEEIKINEEKLNESYQKIKAGQDEISSKRQEIENGLSQIDASFKESLQVNDQLPDSNENQTELGLDALGQANSDDFEEEIAKQKAPLLAGLEEIKKKEVELNKALASYKQGKAKFEEEKKSGAAKLDQALKTVNNKQTEISRGWTSYYQGLDELEKNRVKGANELEKAYKDLIKSKADYEKGLKEFEDKKSESLDDIEEGEEEIKDQKETLLKLTDPEYNVSTIFDNEGIDTYYQNSLNMDKLSLVFPVFFYMVAMLVTLTTMKRYIEEQRLINGSLKSLGYSNKLIARRFYIYGLIPTLIGSIIGGILARYLIAGIIFKAYSTGFSIINMSFTSSLLLIIGSVILSASLVALTVFFTSKETVNESPARLLQAKAPEKGSQILLEKIKPIWKRLSFMQKITARNLFRYKSRMFMTLFGVAGCTALIFFGFAMIDSLKDTSAIQQNELFHYQSKAILDQKSDRKIFDDLIEKDKRLEIRNESASLNRNGTDLDLSIIIPKDMARFNDFVSLRKNINNPINLKEAKAVITKNASKKLKLKENDKIKVEVDKKLIEIEIGSITENYVGDYLYISKDYYEDLTSNKLSVNADYIKGDPDKTTQKLEDCDEVLAVINTSGAYESMDALLANLNLVIVVITLVSSVLASVVLYNITDINVSERKRELATIKVLGFYPKEVTAYIYREIFILSLIGIGGGYLLGYLMFRYIIDLVAPRDIMLSYKLHPLSFIVSAAITLILSMIMLIYVHNKLKNIDMAEAMSSGE
ncbi:FtsX-like permease family protein [Anaerococcus sp. NML200574]|uniref:FtsX-like permease family protein n=1 Tax=Anaerococcus sp. NML200574 TaxID=2954486 RepID=UPI002237A138|nr:FtsX-like permease family protein [Anaerococcus sp. NML200574]MCW6677963.1 FtsX-like permease family protein [Anaerococcus sp. NML200574]